MLFNLGFTDKTVYMSTEQYFNMTDDDISQMIAFDHGSTFVHPFTDTALITICEEEPDEEEVWENEDQEDRDLFSKDDIEELLSSDNTFD